MTPSRAWVSDFQRAWWHRVTGVRPIVDRRQIRENSPETVDISMGYEVRTACGDDLSLRVLEIVDAPPTPLREPWERCPRCEAYP